MTKTSVSRSLPVMIASAVIALLLVAAAWPWLNTSLAGARIKSSSLNLQQEMGRRFRHYEDLQLDPAQIAPEVRRTGHLALRSSTQNFELNLVVNDLRAPNYHAQEVGEDGVVHELPIEAPRTYKGSVAGMPDARARFTIDDDLVEGMIIRAGEIYFVEALRKYHGSAAASDFILYKASDVIVPDQPLEGEATLPEKLNRGSAQFAASTFDSTPEVFSPFKVVEIATEADFEYVTALGGAAAANNDILSILNQVEGIYEQQIGLTFSVVFQNAWSTSADPYFLTGDPLEMLKEFTNYWQANFSGTSRDLAHLFTGRSLGGPSGIAWQSVVCRTPGFAYGLSIQESFPLFRVSIPAHEMGHNFGATHPDDPTAPAPGCDNTIMISIATPANTLNFCQFSIDQITNYVNANSGCLSTANPLPTIQMELATYNFSEGVGNAQVHVKRTGDTTGASSVNFSTGGNSFFSCDTFNGSAVQNCDFTLNQGTLNFAAGQSDRSINILINDDTYVEGNETLSLTLSSPVGATLGSPSSATITITDNDSAGATVPAPKTFIAALASSLEVPPTGTTGKGGGMVQLDGPETGGKAGLIFSNLSSAETAAHIHGAAPVGTNAPILFPLPLGTVTNFAISPTGQQVADLKAGLHYMNVHSNNFLNGEIRGQLLWNPLNEVDYFVTQHYYDFLGRLPDQSGFDFWTNEMKQCGINVQCFRDKSVDVSNAFFYEQEYQQSASYVFLLYRAAYGNTQPFPNPDPANPTEANKLPRYLTFVRDRAQVTGGSNLAASQKALADAFVQRAEFTSRYPLSLSTGAQFVDAILATISTADGAVFAAADRTALITHFNNGGRGLVMFHLANDYWNGCNRLPGSPAAPCVPA
ncbi:MAG: hypothetical protein QOD75_1204, partial [Blastocatellia bacterium]|nr:hypothetical protein [Blastocatellia bacterium]